MDYQETLPNGGILHIGGQGAYVAYSCQGPDLRYQSHEVRIPGECLMEYADALALNFESYQEARRNQEPFTEKEGLLGMKIRLGLYGGVRMGGNLEPIRTQKQLEEMQDCLKAAAKRIKEWKL